MSSSFFFILGVVLYVTLTFLFKKVFYKGKLDSNNRTVFNLSTYAEIALVMLFLSIGVFEIVNLCISTPIWYNWVFPVFWMIYFLQKAFFVFVNRNNYFEISESTFKYRVRNDEGCIKIVSYRFRERESAAPSFSRSLKPLSSNNSNSASRSLVLVSSSSVFNSWILVSNSLTLESQFCDESKEELLAEFDGEGLEHDVMTNVHKRDAIKQLPKFVFEDIVKI